MEKRENMFTKNKVILISITGVILILASIFFIKGYLELIEENDNLKSENNSLKNQIHHLAMNEAVDNYIEYECEEVDFINKTYKIKFTSEPSVIGEDVSVILNNDGQRVSLTPNNGIYEGIIEFPIRKKASEVEVYTYVDGNLVWDEIVEDFDLPYVLDGFIKCHLVDDNVFLGNGILTIADDLKYKLKLKDEIESIQLVCNGKTTDVDVANKGTVAINESISIKDTDEAGTDLLYLNVKTKTGISLKICPELYGEAFYSLDENVDTPKWEDEGYVQITLPNGEQMEFEL